jgi:nucleoside-diphosphate-sugar epimerase
MQIGICGVGSFIGQRLAGILLDRGYDIIVTDRNQ